ncbi:hypothetical protein MMIC_P1799 [Mariprofundus micogutta]|uniref:Uncharacterized protein n=1 Tax=Mariprofundus micogutta TaxID=1921010 RepID=A0A1L8CPL5_9PROT|nr:hypothetical protein [Mariprofundus micogutta]GAV20824.1 hypothetical protein MMIC_P1799 [Mariprofundus micogutta]
MEDEIKLSGFVRHPTGDDLEVDDLHNLKLCITELDDLGSYKLDEDDACDVRMLLITKKDEFDRTKNPIIAMEAFVISHKVGLFPPMWVLNFFANGFEEYHEALGKISLDRVLGLVRGKGQTNAFKELINKDRNENVALEAYRLRHLFNISIEEAAFMVFRRIEHMDGQNNWDLTGLNIRAISEETIKDICNRGIDPFRQSDHPYDLSDLSLEDKLKWLEPYRGRLDSYEFPDKIKSLV